VTSGFQEGTSCLDLRRVTDDSLDLEPEEKVREIYVRRVSRSRYADLRPVF
jgi:hypothetical protein